MSLVARIARGAWDFLVGDDWVAAAGTAISIAATAAVAAAGVPAWWVMPVGVLATLTVSLRRGP
jgi:hypothetical protein